MSRDTDRLLARIARLEAQSAIRGRAVVIYRERAREAEAQVEAWRKQYDYDMGLENDRADAAEAERDEWRQAALDERAAALDALEQIKAREARVAEEKHLRMKATAAATEAEARIKAVLAVFGLEVGDA